MLNNHNVDNQGGQYVSRETIEQNTGMSYEVSGNILIIKNTAAVIPTRFTGSDGRGAIVDFSPRSQSRMRKYLRECLPEYRNMVTLTYPGFFESDGKAVKEHLRRMLQSMRGYEQNTTLFEYSTFWFLEFQDRGAPHFHLFTTRDFPKEWIAQRWYEIVGSEDERHLRAGTRIESLREGRGGIVSYASKYAGKLEQKQVPEGYTGVGRFWGVSGWRGVVSAGTFCASSQLCDPEVVSRVDMINTSLRELLSTKQAVVIARKEGLLVVKLVSKGAVRRMTDKVIRLKLRLPRSRMFDSMFEDAEVD